MREPAILLSAGVGIGSILLNEDFRNTLISIVKNIVGVKILQVGISLAVGSSRPILVMLIDKFSLEGQIADPWITVCLTKENSYDLGSKLTKKYESIRNN